MVGGGERGTRLYFEDEGRVSASSSLRKEYSSCSARLSRERGFEDASAGGGEGGVWAADWGESCECFSRTGTDEGGGVGVVQSQPILIQNLVVVG